MASDNKGFSSYIVLISSLDNLVSYNLYSNNIIFLIDLDLIFGS